MAENATENVIAVLGTHKEGTELLLNELSSQYIQRVYLYNEVGDTSKEVRNQAEGYCHQLNSLQTSTTFESTSSMGHLSRSNIIIMWGFQFQNLRSGKSAIKKFFRVLMTRIHEDAGNPKILFSSNQRGLIYATLLRQITIGILDCEIRVISSMAMVGNKVFGNGLLSARVWPTSDGGFYIEDGENADKFEKVDFLRRKEDLPILEAACVIQVVKIHSSNIPEAMQRVRIMGRFPSVTEAENYQIEKNVAVFLPQDAEEIIQTDEVINHIKSLSEFVSSSL